MNCKNCGALLHENDIYCANCGGKVVTTRLNFKRMVLEVIQDGFGWDNRYFFTLREMLVAPQRVLQSYFDGVRGRYASPISFFVIGMTISLLVLSQFTEKYVELNTSFTKEQQAQQIRDAGDNEAKVAMLESMHGTINSYNEKYQRGFVKYFNILTFLFLPIYSFISLKIYRNRYNYGEHIVANAYIQGITFFITPLLLVLSILVHPSIYGTGLLFVIAVYFYVLTKLHGHTVKQAVWHFLKFLLALLFLLFCLALIGALFAFVYITMNKELLN